MLISVKRALAVPFIAAVAVLPVMPGGHLSAARASVARPATAIRTSGVSRTEGASRASATAPTAGAATPATLLAKSTKHHHHPRKHHRSRRMQAYIWAAHQKGKWYCWGGTGGCFDCSGLVMAAYRHEGLQFGRDTGDMLASSRLVRVSLRNARKGDLVFYGTGHVELYASRKYTFGALHTGTRLGWHRVSQWFRPTMYFRVRGAH